MREDEVSHLFAQCYGLVLGLALGAFVSTVPLDWRAFATETCRVGQAEAGQIGDRACAPVDTVAAGDLGAVAVAAALPRGIDRLR
ncbi:MAG: hypothetical protein JO128_10815 [Alphaproteobacteria bacterium]|nr:hypothetical protein [Alphaproteobacteria bacterium]